jgi:hypothetical protein
LIEVLFSALLQNYSIENSSLVYKDIQYMNIEQNPDCDECFIVFTVPQESVTEAARQILGVDRAVATGAPDGGPEAQL